MAGNRRGQAILIVVVAMGVVLVGALGLAIDGSQYFTQRVMLQAAADAAAEAGIMSVFDGTNTGSNAYSTSAGSFNCTTTDVRTPCKYARLNGYGSTSDDTVAVDFPSVTGVTLSGLDPTNTLRVTITHNFATSFIALLGMKTATIKAAATAAILSQSSPVPIVVTHPSNSGVFDLSGTPDIKICGGPNKSIQINSSSATAITTNGSNTVDLSHAGKDDDGFCNTGTGGDFGVWGNETSYPGTLLLGTRPGVYIPKSSPVSDPFASVAAPSKPAAATPKTSLADGTNGCPASPSKSCSLYYPGYYSGGISISNETGVFSPGVYYIDGGSFANGANGDIFMSSGLADDPDTGQGMLVYLTGNANIAMGANSTATFVGSSSSGKYKGLLFFQDRATTTQVNHSLGGGGAMSLTGTIYLTYTNMTSSIYPVLTLQGGSGSGTTVSGEIIVGALKMGGNGGITMNLNASPVTNVREIALVK